jgi:hypothetical protein
MTLNDAIRLEILKGIISAVLLLFTWGLGQRMLLFWDLQKKRRELDLSAESLFQQVYGEFKEIARLWRVMKKNPNSLTIEPTARWLLLGRAAAVESRVEALILKLAMERVLSTSDRNALGLFRQAFQQLRQSIRDDVPIKQGYSNPEYHFFNRMACAVSRLLVTAPVADLAISETYHQQSLRSIIDVRETNYEAAVQIEEQP